MRVFVGRNAVQRAPRRAVVTVGMFDGVHRAHQQLIRTTIQQARRAQGTSVVVTFEPDPLVVLDPGRAQATLMPLEARLACCAALGVDWAWVIPFTRPFARTQASQFIQTFLLDRLRTRMLVIGASFMFGRGRQGNLALLRRLGAAHGMRVVSVHPIRLDGALVSSSRIRRLIADGRLTQAAHLLGRRPSLYGTIVRGVGRGAALGFPTANVRLTSEVVPPRGVYAVQMRCGRRRWRGVMNLGVRPTFGPGPLTCEVHLLQCSNTKARASRLRQRAVSVELIARLRAERCFPNPQALARQIARDVSRARRLP